MPTKRSDQPTKPAIAPTIPSGRPAPLRCSCARAFRAGFLREKEWRKLFIRGSPPEDAARHAGTFHYNSRPLLERTRARAMTEDLPFKVVRSNGTDEVLARAMNLLVARAAYREAARQYPEDLIELRQGARVIERSK
jgi:hypothetical protein